MSGLYRPFAKGYGILLGVVILWAGSLGLFLLGMKIVGVVRAFLAGDDAGAGA
ncbi:MAG: hypothetical protein HY721_19830 [Planctomycetes bacterium]|nr:hypothetical protein [Planctomycetota bacterium]